MKSILMTFLLTGIALSSLAQPKTPIDPQEARRDFDTATRICAGDAGRLWGRSLCGPLLFIDPATRFVVANQPGGNGSLHESDGVWTGTLPPEQSCANTAIDWDGTRWTMLLWPLPEDVHDRSRLLAHEMFHRIQMDLDLPARNPSNPHLDALEGRLWLQLEWKALSRALRSSGKERVSAVRDALLFRAERHVIFESAADEESALELNEGVAEYTGVRLSGLSFGQALEWAARRLDARQDGRAHSRSFAYASGPAWGLLLDASPAKGWRQQISSACDFDCLAARSFGIDSETATAEKAISRAAGYGYAEILEREHRREAARETRLADYRRRLIDGEILVLPLGPEVNYSFNPNNLEAFDESRTVYPTLQVSDAWGLLTVDHGAIMTRTNGRPSALNLSAPESESDGELRGDGWTLHLAAGWRTADGSRRGEKVLTRVGAED